MVTDFMSSIAVRVCMACFSVLALSVFIFEVCFSLSKENSKPVILFKHLYVLYFIVAL